ncbi:MAG: bifunctional folylpolyglutamate synthase/dihydrofolate synthase [Dehalococcoidia bacterium]|nr:MAG: bifunctional folylpolyglutamate synthase/dihydrofolate synthase [Dehalococcoidia bacterium]
MATVPPPAPDAASLAAYAEAARGLLARGGFERSGNAAEAKKWGVGRIEAWLDSRGRPDRRPTVHVAGSKGKGTVSTLTAAILRAAGAHTLLLTSPDLHSARERIVVDGLPVTPEAFARFAHDVLADPATAGWSYFEMLTVMGWLAGAAAGCEWQVLEVGLGGRLDTTNAVDPGSKRVAVITPIDLEHTEILGDTIPLIAAEKAGIITAPCAVIASPMRESALAVIRAKASEAGATLHEVTVECALRVVTSNLDGQTLDLKTPKRTYRGLKSPLVGPHQSENIATAVRAAEEAWATTEAATELPGPGGPIPEAAVKRALETTRMPGRFEVIRRRPLTILDGLHTPLAARRFAEAMRGLTIPARRVWVLGILSGKDLPAILDGLGIGEGDEVVVTPPPTPRAADPLVVTRTLRERGAIPQRSTNVPHALEVASALAGERGAVLVVGSLYTVAAAREHLLGLTGDHALGLR